MARDPEAIGGIFSAQDRVSRNRYRFPVVQVAYEDWPSLTRRLRHRRLGRSVGGLQVVPQGFVLRPR